MRLGRGAVEEDTPKAETERLVLVFGATGYVGSYLVPRLIQHGYRVRAAGRNLDVLEARDGPGAALLRADALEPQTRAGALAGVGIAYYLVHSMAAASR